MASRFPIPPRILAQRPEGTRGPSGKRLTLNNSEGSLPRIRGGARSKEIDIDEKPWDELKAAKGLLCYVCGTPTHEAGSGLRACPSCHCVQHKSGLMSHLYSVAHPEECPRSPTASKARKGHDDDTQAAVQSDLNPMALRNAWARLSQTVHHDMSHALGEVPVSNVCGPDEEKTPIMHGIINTGYCKGDRVKTELRLPGACPGAGWDPINCETGQGTVTGPGRKFGEIMVKFDYNGLTCSMKLSHLEHIHVHKPSTHLERSFRRKSHSSLPSLV